MTWLSSEQLRQAELAFQVLDNQGIIDISDDNFARMIVTAAEKYAEAAKAQGPAITIEEAYRQFIHNQTHATRRSKKTILDYERFIGKRFVVTHGKQAVYQLSTQDCHAFVMSFASQLDRFKSYGYLYAFLNFCTGKRNPAIDPVQGKPWITHNPINFQKPRYELKDIESYTLNEVKKILVAARESGALGYILFRLFTLCRFEEFHRFVSLGGGSKWSENKFIDLPNKTITFNGQVFLKKSHGQLRGRRIPIHPTFRVWIDYCEKQGIGFTYDRIADETARKTVAQKFGRADGHNNLLRHSAITFHLKAFGNAADTAYIAGTSTDKIDSNYYNARVTAKEATNFYRLLPSSVFRA